jgi:hypothetical protein
VIRHEFTWGEPRPGGAGRIFVAARMQRILNFVDGHSWIVKLAPDWHQAIPENKKVSRR